jgi:hypothetical protein
MDFASLFLMLGDDMTQDNGEKSATSTRRFTPPDGPTTTDDEDEDGSKYLTDELRKKFAKTGAYMVEQQVLTLRYKAREKRLAAIEWLARYRRRERYYNVAMTAVPAILAALIGAFGAAYWNEINAEKRQLNEQYASRTTLSRVLEADIAGLLTQEKSRHEALTPDLKKLVEVPYPSGSSTDPRLPRPWLMAPAVLQFPVFEQNAGRLGLLPAPLPEQVASFYGQSYALRSHVNIVTSPAIILAGGQDKQFAVDEYEKAFKDWTSRAQAVLQLLEQQAGRHP